MTYGTDLTVDEADSINMSNPALGMEEVGTRIRDLEVAMTRLKAEGTIPVPLTSFRLLVSNDTTTIAAKAGGVLANNTDPTWKRVTAAAGGVTEVAWGSGSVVSIMAQVPLPENLNPAQTMKIQVRAKRTNAATTTKAKGTLYCAVNFNDDPTASASVHTSGTISQTAFSNIEYTVTATQIPTAAKFMIMELYRVGATATEAGTKVDSCRITYNRTLA